MGNFKTSHKWESVRKGLQICIKCGCKREQKSGNRHHYTEVHNNILLDKSPICKPTSKPINTMYYQEKYENGILYCRTSPHDQWKPIIHAELSKRTVTAEDWELWLSHYRNLNS